MRRLALIFTLGLIPLVMSAQPGKPRPEEPKDSDFVQMQSSDMASRLGLEGATRDKFISTYKAFREEINTISHDATPAEKVEGESEIDQALQKNFEVSEKILDIRKKYYTEFKTFLKPSQIRQMYHFENEQGRRQQDGPAGPAGQGGPGGPGEHGGPGNFRPDNNRMGGQPPFQFGYFGGQQPPKDEQ